MSKNLAIDGEICENVSTIQAYDTDKDEYVSFVDTSDGTATANDLVENKIAYVDGKRLVGTGAGIGGYHITLTAESGSVTQEQYDKLQNDPSSYIVMRIGDNVKKLDFAIKSATGVLEFTKVYDQASFKCAINADLSYSCSKILLEAVANKKQSLSVGSTEEQYPSAKSVYNYVDAMITAVLNTEV